MTRSFPTRRVADLASGVPPASIAAITFTRLAADELAGRVRETVDELLAKRVPRPLQTVLPEGLADVQHRALEAAAAGLDGLTTTTIHGRSEEHTSELQSLMRISYAVFSLKK